MLKNNRAEHLRIGKILKAEPIAGADKLLRLEVDLGPEQRQLVAGIVQQYTPEVLIGRQIVVLANLEPRVPKGVASQGMLPAADDHSAPVLLSPDREVPPPAVSCDEYSPRYNQTPRAFGPR